MATSGTYRRWRACCWLDRAVWFYAGKLVWPYPLIFFYPRWVIDTHAAWQYLYPAAALAVLVVLWLGRRQIGRGPLAAVLIFVGVLVPALGFFDVFPFRYSYVADHFQYHACLALFALAAASGVPLARRYGDTASWLPPVAALGVVVPLAVLAEQQTRVYRDRFTLLENTLALNPSAWVAPQDLGNLLYDQGKYEQALAYDRQALEVLERLVREDPSVNEYRNTLAASYVSLGFTQQKLKRNDDAAASYVRSIAIRDKLVREHPDVPEFRKGLVQSRENLARVHRARGKLAEAKAEYAATIPLRERLAGDDPSNGDLRDDLAANYVDLGLAERDLVTRPRPSKQSTRRSRFAANWCAITRR